MATVQRNKKSTLSYKVITAVDAGGTATLKTQNISNFNPEVTDDQARLIGVDIAGLVQYELDSVSRTVSYELAEQS